MSHYGLEPTSFRVVIAALGGADPADGFIDHQKMQTHMAAGSMPSTADHGRAKRRGNSRWESILASITLDFNLAITDLVATGATATTEATSFEFTATVDRAGAIATADENNPGDTLVDGPALRRLVARALMIERTDRHDFIDLTETAAKGPGYNEGAMAARYAEQIEDTEVGALAGDLATAEAAVTVTEL
jgi:hypothetical protein